MCMLAMVWRSQCGYERKRKQCGRRKQVIRTAPREGCNSVQHNNWSEKPPPLAPAPTTMLVSLQTEMRGKSRQPPSLVSWTKRRLIKDMFYLFWMISSRLWNSEVLTRCLGSGLEITGQEKQFGLLWESLINRIVGDMNLGLVGLHIKGMFWDKLGLIQDWWRWSLS